MSRDAQQYSLENQKAQIAAYAAEHRIEVVATYADAGKSGVRLEGESLQQLLADVLTGQADFKLILVQDISRWGRFQDPDEAAHYEYICRTAGVDIQYCAEAFRNSATPTGSVLKAMKRLMAAEYSRELSRKCFAGAARLSALGFRQGGAAGYGLRRQLVDENGKTKIWLDAGDQKYLSTDRVVLTLGPAHEVETVRRIYRLFTYEGCGKQQIADLLNAEGLRAKPAGPGAPGLSPRSSPTRSTSVPSFTAGRFAGWADAGSFARLPTTFGLMGPSRLSSHGICSWLREKSPPPSRSMHPTQNSWTSFQRCGCGWASCRTRSSTVLRVLQAREPTAAGLVACEWPIGGLAMFPPGQPTRVSPHYRP
uniref:Recombinase family protein n=1 Tax=Phenylobacterium glaciei TaxID=2803784 RepID=A0A974P1Y0_9CAUL|nr:recombinase family protein [Phenylobacterium glaciei]